LPPSDFWVIIFPLIGGYPNMYKISRFIVWICSHFRREDIQRITAELTMILNDPNAKFMIKKDEFKEEHPNYRNFDADEDSPLNEPMVKKKRRKTSK
jgi:C4-type Zn-finger protein